MQRHPEQPAVPEVVHLVARTLFGVPSVVLRSVKSDGVVSKTLSKTLMTPLFSATKTRPSEAKRTTVGLVSPLKTVVSSNPAGGAASALLGSGGDRARAGEREYQERAREHERP